MLAHARCLVPLFLLPASVAAVAALPPDILLTPIVAGAGQPVALAQPDDGSGRLFVVDRRHGLRIIEQGRLLATPFLDIDVPTDSEHGVLGLAFDADFASNGVFYLTFTAPQDEPRLGEQPDQVLARFTATDPAADVFQGTRTDILRIPDIYANHNGGNIHFGPDGYLYWSMGDGGNGGDPNDFAQDPWKKNVDGHDYYLLGKMLRLDVRHGDGTATAETCGAAAGTTIQYRIPADNPFTGSSNTCDEIYHLGLRNPWRFSFDRATGELYIGDVGQGEWEEVDRVPAGVAGLNFGWDCREGHAGYDTGDCTPASVLVEPVFDYSHDDGCSITGGYVYRGPDAGLDGLYFYGDYCSQALRYAEPATGHWHDGAAGTTGVPLETGLGLGSGPVGFSEDLDGRLYALTSNGHVWRIDTDALFADGFE